MQIDIDKRYKTAITRTKLSSPMAWLKKTYRLETDDDILDYGCGKGFDADELCINKYDPKYFPIIPSGNWGIITCNYVLNVIESNDDKLKIVKAIQALLNDCPESRAYLSVRRDLKVDGYTKSGTWQENVFIQGLEPIYERKGYFAIYEITKTTNVGV